MSEDNPEPERPSDPRPNNEPYFISSTCNDCRTDLVLKDELENNDTIWHDEWICPDCQHEVYLDIPSAAE